MKRSDQGSRIPPGNLNRPMPAIINPPQPDITDAAHKHSVSVKSQPAAEMDSTTHVAPVNLTSL
jgi:hypothetical protein